VAVKVGVGVLVLVKVEVTVVVGVTVGVPQYTSTTTSFENTGKTGLSPSIAPLFVISPHPVTCPHHVKDPEVLLIAEPKLHITIPFGAGAPGLVKPVEPLIKLIPVGTVSYIKGFVATRGR
jgi:hypothetical protein